jgi:hypothetical protein
MLLASAVLLAAVPGRALLFTQIQLNGRLILVVHDCGSWEGDASRKKSDGTIACQESDSHFSKGDDVTFERVVFMQELQRRPYDEVWLISGGGDVEAGIGIGRALRRHRMTVRVPKGYDCVSSCTIAFMGGLFRFIDEGATYQVHSASSVSRKLPEAFKAELQKDPSHLFATWADIQQVDARYMAIRLLMHFENTLLLLQANTRQLSESDRDLYYWAESKRPHLAYLDSDNPERLSDVKKFKSEGASSAQDIAMRIERESMTLAIQDLEADLPNLGPRAKPALDMVKAMYMTSIKETSTLSQTELVKMGYVTPEFKAEK